MVLCFWRRFAESQRGERGREKKERGRKGDKRRIHERSLYLPVFEGVVDRQLKADHHARQDCEARVPMALEKSGERGGREGGDEE